MKFQMEFHDTTYGPDNVLPVEGEYHVCPFPIPRVGEKVIDVEGRLRDVREVEYKYDKKKTLIAITLGGL